MSHQKQPVFIESESVVTFSRNEIYQLSETTRVDVQAEMSTCSAAEGLFDDYRLKKTSGEASIEVFTAENAAFEQ